MKKVYVIEDHVQLQKYIKEYLEMDELEVVLVSNYENVVEEMKECKPDIVIVDINLPLYDGFYYVKLIKKNFDLPIVIVSARSDESEQIRGLQAGAIDYICKPVSLPILQAKIHALLREDIKEVKKEVFVEQSTMKLHYKEESIELTKNEFILLQYLLEEEGKIVKRETLLELLWNDFSFVDDNTLTVNITRMKKKLEEVGIKERLQVKRGVGYVFLPKD